MKLKHLGIIKKYRIELIELVLVPFSFSMISKKDIEEKFKNNYIQYSAILINAFSGDQIFFRFKIGQVFINADVREDLINFDFSCQGFPIGSTYITYEIYT
jgi:hypothetical protein